MWCVPCFSRCVSVHSFVFPRFFTECNGFSLKPAQIEHNFAQIDPTHTQSVSGWKVYGGWLLIIEWGIFSCFYFYCFTSSFAHMLAAHHHCCCCYFSMTFFSPLFAASKHRSYAKTSATDHVYLEYVFVQQLLFFFVERKKNRFRSSRSCFPC